MVSARSTVSMARTTPAQKPRGEQSTTFRSDLAGMGAISGPNHPSPAGQGRSNGHQFGLRLGTGLGLAFRLCQGTLAPNPAPEVTCITQRLSGYLTKHQPARNGR